MWTNLHRSFHIDRIPQHDGSSDQVQTTGSIALSTERVLAGLAVAKKRARVGGRPAAIPPEKLELIVAALDGGMLKAAVCRNFAVKRTTLVETLARQQAIHSKIP